MTARIILQAFDQYQKARTTFVHTVADLATRVQNIEHLVNAGVLDLLRPLLSDVVPSIQQTAAVALGRMANHDGKIAQAIVSRDILPQLLQSISKQNKFYKRAALFVLRAVSQHSPEMAQVVVQSGGLEAMVVCLEDFDPGVKEAAALALGYIGRHNRALAQAVVDAGAVPILVTCLQEPELSLKQIAASALHDISKHSIELAQTVVDAGCIAYLAKSISNPDRKLKRQVLAALSSIAKHSVQLSEMIVEAKVFPDILLYFADPDDEVKRNAANLVKEVTKQSLELSQLVVNTGGIGALIELISSTKGSIRLPAIMALGHIGAISEEFAMAIIGSKGVTELAIVLDIEKEEHVVATVIWALGQIGKHTPEHAKALALANVFPKIIQLYTKPGTSEDLQQKSRTTLKQVLQKCMYMSALEPLLETAPPFILKYVVGQYSKILPNDPKARRAFVTSGGLKKLQEIKAEPGTTLMEYITIINCCYPDELINYYSPGYPNSLLERIDQYQPQIKAMFNMSERQPSEDDVDMDIEINANSHLHALLNTSESQKEEN
ncbi:hypothetical protein L9F63_000818 [Diploptera punctata]|uniref:Sperm-associated antigen 6 n=1 Tax=Diploptera punctata TaxID=6984 RepID=A0AAD8AKV4_DIPPU|nr:hypothetical protein L9F63_000818 [Diploptera punctata]